MRVRMNKDELRWFASEKSMHQVWKREFLMRNK